TRAQQRSNAPRHNGSISPGHKSNGQSPYLRPRIQVGSVVFSRCSLIEKHHLIGVWALELLSSHSQVFARSGGGGRSGFFVPNLQASPKLIASPLQVVQFNRHTKTPRS